MKVATPLDETIISKGNVDHSVRSSIIVESELCVDRYAVWKRAHIPIRAGVRQIVD
jgi:hypothetical protein